eukprot:67232-Alexandrium_andersonii.AAC.1
MALQLHAHLRLRRVARWKSSPLRPWFWFMHRPSWPAADSARIATGRKPCSQGRLRPRRAAHSVSRTRSLQTMHYPLLPHPFGRQCMQCKMK